MEKHKTAWLQFEPLLIVDKGFCSNMSLCRADVKAIINEMESEKRRYTTKDGSWLVGSLISGEVERDGQGGFMLLEV